MGTTDFSAKEPALGYYYQIRFSLYLLLKARDKNDVKIQVETLDDIVLDDTNFQNLFQTKLHINSITNLTDASPDFWKTVRVWSESILKGYVDAKNTIFTLLTTATIGTDSFLEFLRQNSNRNNEVILDKMKEVAMNSRNVANKPAYKAFNTLEYKQQLQLIENIFIIDAALSIDDALTALKRELVLSCAPNHIEALVERLEGWWFAEVIKCLQKNDTKGISLKELQVKITDITYSFQEENLPDDFADPLLINESDLDSYEEKIFIQQLKLVAARSNMLRTAISDFRRAFEQRSKWLREELATIDEVELFEKRLYDHWNNIFMALKDDAEGLSEEKLKIIGIDFYRKFYVDTCPPIRIRAKFQSEYLTRGSCHILSEQKKIGWHPDFKNRIT